MGEDSLPAVLPFDRTVQQAIVSIKKGACLLKCGRRGKPKFCPFRLSTDEKFLIWYSGEEERQLRLSSVMKIVPGQKTISFKRQLQPEKESQSFSLIYANGERSLDLVRSVLFTSCKVNFSVLIVIISFPEKICKDKGQAESWILGLRVLISRSNNSRPLNSLRSHRGAQSCVSSPAGFLRRKYNLGLLEDAAEFSQVHSICGSPALSLSERCFSNGLSNSSDSFYWSESAPSTTQNVTNISGPNSPYIESYHLKKRNDKNVLRRLVAATFDSPLIEKKNILKDVLVWGEIVEGGGNGKNGDVLLPKLLESTMNLDLQSISIGRKHAAIVTKQGEVFCWGEAKGGRLGHRIDMDVSHPKLVDSLSKVQVNFVACSEYKTYALTYLGELYTWGGSGEEENRNHWLPFNISSLLDGITIASVACGEWHSAIVSTTGMLFTYGDGTFGVLGHGDFGSVSQPKEVDSLKGLRVKSVACGSWHTAAIVEVIADRLKFNAIGGKLFTWGDGDKGRLGHSDKEKKPLPTCVAKLVDHDFIQVCCGRTLTMGLTSHGAVYTMGSATHGQLGNPRAKDKSITVVEGKLKEEFVKEIASGSYHVAILTTRGNVYTWGKGGNGQLGLGDVEDRSLPTLVEALGDRQVESVICGSNSTAAVCLHKSITVTDQSVCSGCKEPFGFTRKKHNCYNCGLVFCHACSSKKAVNVSLAPNKSKAFRVCDHCFRNHGTRQLLTEQKGFQQENESRIAATPKYSKMLSVKQPSNKEVSQLNRDPSSLLLGGMPQWGKVECPALFELHPREVSLATTPLSMNQVSNVSPGHLESNLSSATIEGKGMSFSDEMLIEEVQRLRVQTRSLEKKLQIGNQKIQECQQKLEETWSLAREEAARCKAAKEVIKALALRLHKVSENVSAGRKEKDGVDTNIPQITPALLDSPAFGCVSPASVATTIPGNKQIDSMSNSPIVFSKSLKFLYERDSCRDSSRLEDDSNVGSTDPQQPETKVLNTEWVEQYEPGVYITFTILPSGQKGLKRVRFSRKRFTEREAERWWEENQLLMYQKYEIEGYVNSNKSQI
ncbi:hypothetical protein UlMin_023744 [Ulmus minor]